MGSSKSPGNDGLTKEFYVCFFKDVGQYLTDALNLSFDYGMLSTSQRQVVITLLEKKGKDKRYLKNWRPISLINVDTKILSKSLALRIKKVLSSLIHSDQTAYVKDRYIGESVRLINDVLEFTDHKKTEAILFSADFEKAFDSIDHSFLLSALKCFGFDDEFIQWVRTLLNNAESCEINNGHSTGYFLLERGTRQGDPLSAYLFILVLEILFIQIRNNREIHAIEIDDVTIKLSAYADDTYFFTLDSQSLQIILKVCENFSAYSTLKLNVEKSQACWIGSAKGGISKPADCNWVDLLTDTIITLGIYNSYDRSIAEKHNLVNLLINVKDSLKMWNFRELTLAGKIQIFKSLALSKAVYIGTMTSPSRQFLDQLNLLKRDFIWDGKSTKIKHSTLIGCYAEGGYKDVDIESKFKSLKIIWIKKLLDDNFHPWKIIPNKLFSFTGMFSVFLSKFRTL